MEDDFVYHGSLWVLCRFQSTSPVWRTTPRDISRGTGENQFQSTSPVWRTTHKELPHLVKNIISIHVPRVEDDQSNSGKGTFGVYFNPRPPCGGRQLYNKLNGREKVFQSTSPVWRTTTLTVSDLSSPTNFNPRPPCGGRPLEFNAIEHDKIISIHVPRVEDDIDICVLDVLKLRFQSTSPVWRTTVRCFI